MIDEIMNRGANSPVLCLAWETFCQNAAFWKEECTIGVDLCRLLYKFAGREPCERLALYWNQKGRDDIAARIKNIIHQKEETKPCQP